MGFNNIFSSLSPFARALFIMAMVVLNPALSINAYAADQLYRFHPGVHTSRQYPFPDKQRQALLIGLRFCTGFTEISFDESGQLDIGDRTRVVGGSTMARDLVIAAVDSTDSFTLENRYHSPAIAFAQIEPIDDYQAGDGRRQVAWQIRIDFFDFTALRGPRAALAAFDPTMNLLHELVHGVFKLKDPVDDSDKLGDCERYLNRIRAELGLLERDAYLPKTRLAQAADSYYQQLQAEFIFVQKDSRGRGKDFYMTYTVARVCDLTEGQTASVCFRDPLIAGLSQRRP